jgi:SAM-dependent methyltransferase
MRVHLWEAISDVLGSFRKRGVAATLSLLLPEFLFDWRFGTDTFVIVTNEELSDVTSPDKPIGIPYQGTNPKLFMDTFRAIGTKLSRDFSQETLVDFGCGKGRALLMAASCGFRKVIGVDYSPGLCKVAEKNIEIVRKRMNTGTQFEVVHADVRTYPIPDEVGVFFFFNPFGEELLVSTVARIEQSAIKNPRAVLVVYLNPQFPHAFDPKRFRKVLVIGEGRDVPDALVFELISAQGPLPQDHWDIIGGGS